MEKHTVTSHRMMGNISVTITKLLKKNLLQDQNSGDKICYRKRIVEKNLFHAQNCGNVFLLQEMSNICNFYDRLYAKYVLQ